METARFALVESNTTGTGIQMLRAARRRGLEPELLAADPARYPWAAAEGVRVTRADTASVRAVLKSLTATPGRLVGVASTSDRSLVVAAEVAATLGLPGPDPAALRRCRDKYQQRLHLRAAAVAVPAFEVAASADVAVRAAIGIGLPVVVKPVDGTGSIGVRLCADASMVALHTTALIALGVDERGQPTDQRVLVEQYIEGEEFSVEALDDRVIGITRKHLGAPPAFVEVGHDFPATLPTSAHVGAVATTLAALQALGLAWGPTHTELRFDAAKRCWTVVEVNPRCAGGRIADLVHFASGLDLVDAWVARTTGDAAAHAARVQRYASIRFVTAKREDVVIRVEGAEVARLQPEVVDVAVYATPGSRTTLQGDFRDRIGHSVAVANSAAAAAAAAERAAQTLRFIGATGPIAGGAQ